MSLYIPGFFLNLGWAIVSPILPLYAESFDIPYALVGLVITANALGRILSDIPLGVVCDRVGRRPLAILGPVIVTVSAVLCGLAQGFYELLAYRFVTGTGMAMWMVARQATLADSVDPSIRGRVLSTFQSVNMIGSATGPAVGGIIAELSGYRAPFFFYAASTAVCALASFLMVKESATGKRDGGVVGIRIHIRQILGFLTFPILVASFTSFTNNIRFGARAILIPLFGNDVLGLGPGEIGLILSASTVANILMAVPGGYMVDKYGRKAALVPAFVFTGITFSLFPFSSSFASITLVATVLGVASGLGGGATMAVAADLAPDNLRGLFLGFWQTVGDFGSAICPVALGLIADSYGLEWAFHATATLMVVTAMTTHFFVGETMKGKAGSRCR